MPQAKTAARAAKAKSPSTQAGEYVREEVEHVREGKHRRSRATLEALKHEGSAAASHEALSRHARKSAQQRGSANRRKAAEKAVRAKGAAGRHDAAVKAARTRAHGGH